MGAQENDKPVWIGSNNRRFNIKFAYILVKNIGLTFLQQSVGITFGNSEFMDV